MLTLYSISNLILQIEKDKYTGVKIWAPLLEKNWV